MKFHFEMKLCSLQIKAACQKVHIIKSHKPAHKRKVFYSFTSKRCRIHVSRCWLWRPCWDSLERMSFCPLATWQHQRLCILILQPLSPRHKAQASQSVSQELCYFGILLCWCSHQDSEMKWAAYVLDNLLYSFLYNPHHKRGRSGNSTQISNL